MRIDVGSAALAAIYGAMAGAVTALVLALMNAVSSVVWSVPQTPLYIFVLIMIGGALIAVLRRFDASSNINLADQLANTHQSVLVQGRQAAVLAGTAIVAVAFGGAIGPEAGVIAVVTELSALVQLGVLRNRPVAREIVAEAGTAGALAGLYASPPGGAVIADGEEDKLPRPLILLASVGGLLGLYLVASFFVDGVNMRVHLAAIAQPHDLGNMLQAVVPALLGGAIGVCFRLLFPTVTSVLHRFGNPTLQILMGTFVFAVLAATFPILRFSGHHELHAMLEWGRTSGMWALLVLAALKVFATAVCLASGWRGGSIFPLYFAGAAAGGAALWLMPSIDPTVALISGMVAASTVGIGKPIAAMLISVFMISPFAAGPVCVAAIIGYGLSRMLPPAELH